MDIIIDLATMDVLHPGGAPLTDISLVVGDTLPLRVTLLDDGVPVAPSGVKPALAVKTSPKSDTLVLAAANLEPVDDALGIAYVGTLSVNTTQLVAAMGDAESIDMAAEMVLISGDGAQRSSSLIRVRVRRDILPADYAPPAEVLADWSELVADALAAQLPDALQSRGMYVSQAGGSSILSTVPAEDGMHIWTGCYAFEWGDEILPGHLPDRCRLRRVTMDFFDQMTDMAMPRWLRVWRLDGDHYVVAGLAPAVTLPSGGGPIVWDITPGAVLSRGDRVIFEVCAGASADQLVTCVIQTNGLSTPVKDGRGMAFDVSHPVATSNPYAAPVMSLELDYVDAVSVGGVELATVQQVEGLGEDVRTASSNAQAAASDATSARDEAQEIAESLTVTVGSVTTGEPGSNASITLTPGTAPGSWVMGASIPRGDTGAVDASAAYNWPQPQTYAAAINANGGVNVPVAPVMSSNALRYADLWLAHTVCETRCDMAQTPAYSHGASSVGPWGRRINDLPAAGGRAMVGWSSSWDTQQSSRDTLIIRFSCSGSLCNINILIEAVMGYSGVISAGTDYGLDSLMLLASADAIFPVQFGLRFLTLPGFGGGSWATTHVEVRTIGRNNALLAPVKTFRLPVTFYARGSYDFYLIKEVTSASNARVCLCIGAFVGDGVLSLKPGLTRISDWVATNSANARAMLGFGIGFATADQSAPDATQYFSGAPGSGPWMQVSTFRIPASFNLDIR